jgi:flagellin-specific chaperone FliS
LLADIYTIIDKLVFDLLIRTTQNAELVNLTALLMNLVEESPQLMIKLIQERILFEQKVADNVCEHPFFEMLIFNKDQVVREMCEAILTKATSCLFELLENPQQLTEEQQQMYQAMLDKIIEASTSVIPQKIQNAWHKLGPFFNFFYNTVKGLQHNRLMAFQRVKFVTKMVDMVCLIKDHF